jgi:hypothetical protein
MHLLSIIYYLIILMHTLLSRVVPVNEEVAKVESVPEEEPTSVEVGFDICSTNSEPEFPID